MALTNPQGKLILANTAGRPVNFTTTGTTLSTMSSQASVVNRGLVAWWKLEENSVATEGILDTAYTSTGIGSNPPNHGTRFGTAPITDGGISGNAHSFSGDDYIQIASEPNFALEWNQPWTIAAWVNTASIATTKNIFAKFGAPSTDKGWRLIHNNSQYQIQIFHTNSTRTAEARTPVSTLVANQWQHVVATWNGNGLGTGITFYVNGVLQTAVNVVSGGGGLTGGDTVLNGLAPVIGARAGNALGGEAFVGLIDEVMFYNVELTGSEALQLYQSFNNSIVTSGLVSWWRFNNNYKDTALSDTGTGASPANDGTNVGGTYTFVNTGGGFEPNSGLNSILATTSTDYISLGSSSSLRPTTGITIEMRLMHANGGSKGGSNENFIDIGGAAVGNQGIEIQSNLDDTLTVIFRNVGGGLTITTSAGSFPFGVYAYWAVTYDQNFILIYKNGVLVSSTPKTGALSYTFTNAVMSGRVTGNASQDGTNGWANGDRIDMMRLYSRTLSATEILLNYNTGI